MKVWTLYSVPFSSWRLARDRQTYRQTDGLDRVTWPHRGRLHNKDLIKLLTCFLSYFLKCLLSTRQPITLSLCLTEIHWNYKILKIHCRNVGIFLNYKRCYVMELVSALAALGAVLYLASVNTRISTHFVTRSLRHPGDELHIVSPVYTHFVTLCTSSPGWLLTSSPPKKSLRRRRPMHFVTYYSWFAWTLVLMCICDCSVYLYFCIIHYRPIVAQYLV